MVKDSVVVDEDQVKELVEYSLCHSAAGSFSLSTALPESKFSVVDFVLACILLIGAEEWQHPTSETLILQLGFLDPVRFHGESQLG